MNYQRKIHAKKSKANDELRDASVGADPSLPDEDHAPKPAMQACFAGSAPCLEELIRAGADLNARDVNGWTAAMFAARRGSLECVVSLAACGADLSIKTAEGPMPPAWPCMPGALKYPG